MKKIIVIGVAVTAIAAAIIANQNNTNQEKANSSQDETMSQAATTSNPASTLLTLSALPSGYPDFAKVKDTDFLPAYKQVIDEQSNAIKLIVDNKAPATFANTVLPLEDSYRAYNRLENLFGMYMSALSTPVLDKDRLAIESLSAAHSDAIHLNATLFQRLDDVYQARLASNLSVADVRLVTVYRQEFVQSGAGVKASDKPRLKAINLTLAELVATFSNNLKEETKALAVSFETSEQLAGLSAEELAIAADDAKHSGSAHAYRIPLVNTTGQPSLAKLDNYASRQALFNASVSRGSRGGKFDNRQVLMDILRLRAEKAVLLGYDDFASWQLSNQDAANTTNVNERLALVATGVAKIAQQEAQALQNYADAHGFNKPITAADWTYLSAKLATDKYNFDEEQLKPYLALDNVLEKGVFHTATELFGLTFVERTDLPVFHPDVRVWEVKEEDGTTLAFYVADFYARENKEGGAWMNEFLQQSNRHKQIPIVGNFLNIPKPAGDAPTLLTWDEVITLFHEFGHAVHGMMSAVEYEKISGTNVATDFVEFPSQVFEMWATWPTVLANYAIHYQTNQVMPAELLEKMTAAQSFNKGYFVSEYIAATIIDQAWHQLSVEQVPAAENVAAFEQQALTEAGIYSPLIPPRYKSTYFSHIMDGYAAGYYAYVWSEVLDADTVEWFTSTNGLTRANGTLFRQGILSKGNSINSAELYRQFRGKDADVSSLLRRIGLE